MRMETSCFLDPARDLCTASAKVGVRLLKLRASHRPKKWATAGPNSCLMAAVFSFSCSDLRGVEVCTWVRWIHQRPGAFSMPNRQLFLHHRTTCCSLGEVRSWLNEWTWIPLTLLGMPFWWQTESL